MHSGVIPVWLNVAKLAQHPVAAFFIIFFGTWFSEDGAMLASALLWREGKLGWEIVYWANAVGVSFGDMVLYFIGYQISFGLEKTWLRRLVNGRHVLRGRVFFDRWGNWLTFVARFVPGLRVPGYATAGLMRSAFGPFCAIVFLTAFFWVGVQMELVVAAGRHLNLWEIVLLATAILVFARWMLKGFEGDRWMQRWKAWMAMAGHVRSEKPSCSLEKSDESKPLP